MSSSHWPAPLVVLVKGVWVAAFLKIVAYLISSLREVSESLHVV